MAVLQLEVLSQLSRHDSAFLRKSILPGIVRLFSTRRALLEALGSYVFRKLCQLLDPQAIYLYLAEILLPMDDVEFVTLTIEILNLLLLTSGDLVRRAHSWNARFPAVLTPWWVHGAARSLHRRSFVSC